jgi:Trypsin
MNPKTRLRDAVMAGCGWLAWWSGCITAGGGSLDTVEGALPPHAEFGVSRSSADVANRYPAVVLLTSERGACSGTLATPTVVLTAAHCVCLPLVQETLRGVVDSSHCAKSVTVATHTYTVSAASPRQVAPNERLYEGVASAYPGFRAVVGKDGVSSYEGDIAVVRLAAPVQGVKIDFKLPSAEVSIDEPLSMVGYGASSHGGADGGVRRFGTNVVTNIQLVAGGNGAFAFFAEGAHTHAGDSGGPCFREDRAGRWLAGINMGYAKAGAISLFTSAFHYRKWISEQVRKD